MIRLLPRTSDGAADLGVRSLAFWNTSESCASNSPLGGCRTRAAQCRPLRRIILSSTEGMIPGKKGMVDPLWRESSEK